MTQVRYGNQKPRIDIYQNGDIRLADKTITLLEHYGINLLPWQRSVLYRWMAAEKNEDGEYKWVNPECGLLVPRQNGKSELIIARIIGGMIFLGESLVYTAHSDKTVNAIKRRVLRFFYDAEEEIRDLLTEEFDKEPKSFDYVELRNKGLCQFRTRTRTGGLGMTNDCLILDEDQEETDAQQEALLPTISAGKSQNSQTIRAGTPPSGGSTGTVFMRVRTAVLDGKDTDTCWQEWSVESICDPHDEDAWYDANPSLGYFLMVRAVKNEANKMAVDSFNKMRLGWIAGVESRRAISDEQWSALVIEQVELPENYLHVYAIKFAPDGSSISLAVGAVLEDGRVHVELLECRPMNRGTGWIVTFLTENNRWRKANKIIVDGAAGTTLLVEELVRTEKKMSKRILTPNAKQAGAAYGAFDTGIQNKKLTHYNQPTLNNSIRTVKKRSIGKDGMFGYASMNPDIQSDPTEAAAFAYYGAITFKKSETTSGSGQTVQV